MNLSKTASGAMANIIKANAKKHAKEILKSWPEFEMKPETKSPGNK